MAYAVVHSLTQTIDRILNHDDLKQYPISDNGKQHIELLREKAILLKGFLKNSKKEDVNLETRIRDATNRAEDVMEHFMYEHIRSHHKEVRMKEVGREVKRTDILYDFRELKIVMKEINSIVEEAPAIKKEEVQLDGESGPSSAPTSPPTVDDVTVGLEEHVKDIKELLFGGSTKRQVIPITGMGGIGKTTLARTVCKDEEVMEKFPLRAWITVSQNYKTENIFEDLLFNLPNSVKDGVLESGDSTEEKLHKILTVRKFLIVVDDLWSEKAWDDIRKAFGDANSPHGSRIIVTTREENVATHADPDRHLQKMKVMDNKKSWELLKQKVFGKKECPPDLKDIGVNVATSCGGLPLAIVLVAGILATGEETRSSWDKIAKDVQAAVETTVEFGKRIALSYAYLPIHLRPCFIYMGGFPEDHEIRVSKLLKLWIAEEFVANEEEAEGYLNDLVRRNLPSITAFKSNGKFKSCNIHDMVREMSKSKALDENYERRLSIGHPDLTRLARAYASTLRSVLSFQPNESSLGGLRKFKLLRVLDVVDTDAYSLPAPVFELFHLRYLAFGCPMEVPSAISRLQNLRALIVRPSKRLRRFSNDEVYLPLEIWMLPFLTHLVSFFDLLPEPEGAAAALKELLTLSVVKKLICTEKMMKLISNLKKLAITYFGDKYQEDYQLQNLVLLPQLEKLTLVVKKGSLLQVKSRPVFPKTLRKLTLSGWRFPWEYMKDVGSLPELQVLKLRDHAFEGDKWVIEEGQFPKLEYLLIDESDLESWVTEKGDFPLLNRLVLRSCGKLSEIPDAIGDIATLKLIEVDRANTSLLECVQRIYKEQKEEYGNKILQVRAI